MNKIHLISALAIVLAVAIAPATGAFGQPTDSLDAEISDKNIDKEERKQYMNDLKEQRKQLTDRIKEFKEDRMQKFDQVEVNHTLEFTGETSGWSVIGGKAIPATFDLSGKAGQINERIWKITGEGTVHIGDREVIFDLEGYAKGPRLMMKGVSQTDDSVTIHLKGHYAPISENEGNFAIAFTKATIVSSNADVNVPMILVGDVITTSIGKSVDEQSDGVIKSEPQVDIDKMLALLA